MPPPVTSPVLATALRRRSRAHQARSVLDPARPRPDRRRAGAARRSRPGEGGLRVRRRGPARLAGEHVGGVGEVHAAAGDLAGIGDRVAQAVEGEAEGLEIDRTVDERIRGAIDRVLSRQDSSGSFGLWSAGGAEGPCRRR
jgi:hypothetical protein